MHTLLDNFITTSVHTFPNYSFEEYESRVVFRSAQSLAVCLPTSDLIALAHSDYIRLYAEVSTTQRHCVDTRRCAAASSIQKRCDDAEVHIQLERLGLQYPGEARDLAGMVLHTAVGVAAPAAHTAAGVLVEPVSGLWNGCISPMEQPGRYWMHIAVVGG